MVNYISEILNISSGKGVKKENIKDFTEFTLVWNIHSPLFTKPYYFFGQCSYSSQQYPLIA